MVTPERSVFQNTGSTSKFDPSASDSQQSAGDAVKSLVTSKSLPEESFARWRCEEWRDQLLQTSPRIRKLLSGLAENNCALNPTRHISFITCTPTVLGGFIPSVGIQICANHMTAKEHLERSLTHELVHAYDYCTADIKYDNMRHHACTEIRAASLSGDCRFEREVIRGNLGNVVKMFERCVKRRAAISIEHNPQCRGPEHAKEVVEEVYRHCINDTAPFTQEELLNT
ncbi:hypothetical protein PhCBS80983_g02833 [Powellomyces hirtus]|uniref:Mitochondrial inner membrane protease ATP23 n=1 Tax=Powellomyces hirtus TaxID=109895 RepID=A0A507E4V0_9FUNG|nr:mitochondrial inner membrane protease ATP23 [Powellomyces hirtus]TPX58862.1 hypothetical protein PhCBS80983_g02833 [Powellomyces hirtus]